MHFFLNWTLRYVNYCCCSSLIVIVIHDKAPSSGPIGVSVRSDHASHTMLLIDYTYVGVHDIHRAVVDLVYDRGYLLS